MTGKNAPCPCGSGKKYKRCCMGKDLELPPEPPGDTTEGLRAREESLALRGTPPVDSEGFRIVTHEQAMIHFLRPLTSTLPVTTREHARYLITVGEACWAVAEDERSGRKKNIRPAMSEVLAAGGLSDPEAFLDRMVQRHGRLFPLFFEDQATPGLREKILADEEAWSPHPDGEIHGTSGTPSEDGQEIRSMIARLDQALSLKADPILKERFFEAAPRTEASFIRWLVASGSVNQAAGTAGQLARFFMTYLYQFAGVGLGASPEAELCEFYHSWIFRHVNLGGADLHLAPVALKAFALYLDEIGASLNLAPRVADTTGTLLGDFLDLHQKYFGKPSA